MRKLIEEATGIATCTVYHARDFYVSGPCGYFLENGIEGNRRYPSRDEIVVIKTHYPVFKKNKFDLQPYIKVVRIVRDPVDSLYSLYQMGFMEEQQSVDDKFLREFIQHYKQHMEFWDKQKNVYTVRYEDLLDDLKGNFTKIMREIGYRVTHEDIERAVKRYPAQGSELKHIHRFTLKQLEMIQTELSEILHKYDYAIFMSEIR